MPFFDLRQFFLGLIASNVHEYTMTKSLALLCATFAFAQTGLAGEADTFKEPLVPVEESSDSWKFGLSLYAPLDLNSASSSPSNEKRSGKPFAGIDLLRECK